MFFSASFNDDIRGWDVESSDQLSAKVALHISGSIANQLLNLPAFLHFTEHTMHGWRGQQLGWVGHGQVEDVAKARPRAEPLLNRKSSRSSLQLMFFLTRTLHVTTFYNVYNHIGFKNFQRFSDIKPLECKRRCSSGSEPFTAALSRSGAINITASELCPKPVPSPWHKNADLQPSKADCSCRLCDERSWLYINCIHHLMCYHDMI